MYKNIYQPLNKDIDTPCIDIYISSRPIYIYIYIYSIYMIVASASHRVTSVTFLLYTRGQKWSFASRPNVSLYAI